MITMATPKIATNDNERCTYKTEKGRRCLLVVHTDQDKHIMVNRVKPEDKPKLASVLPKGFKLSATEVKPGEGIRKATGRKPEPRDADQKMVDGLAKANYDKNHAAGIHAGKDWDDFKLSETIVPPEAVDVALDYFRKANNNGGSVPAKSQFRYKKGFHASGNVRLHWAYVDPQPPAPPSPAAPADAK